MLTSLCLIQDKQTALSIFFGLIDLRNIYFLAELGMNSGIALDFGVQAVLALNYNRLIWKILVHLVDDQHGYGIISLLRKWC